MRKLSLEELRVTSFVTKLKTDKIRGGDLSDSGEEHCVITNAGDGGEDGTGACCIFRTLTTTKPPILGG